MASKAPSLYGKTCGEIRETVTDINFLGSKITGDWSHEIKRHLLLGRKVKTNLDSILKNRHIALPTMVHLVEVIVFPGVTYGCESEHWRTDAFELWCWRRLLIVPWTARRSNQSILKEVNPEYSLEGMLLKLNSNTLATGYERLTHWERHWCWERLKAKGKVRGRGWNG